MVSKEAMFEAVDWALFSFGAFIAAFVLPVQIIVTLLFIQPVPRGPLVSLSPISLANLYLFVVLGGAAWHGIHRIRFVLFDLGLNHHKRAVTIVSTVTLAEILIWAFYVLFLQ